ncbi:MAG: metallophosphoesterase family protein [Candidatus Buchananbacteria bacterium]
MKVAVISDTHDNAVNTEKFLSWAKNNQIEKIVHCGDIAAPSMIKELFGPAGIDFHCVFGNVADRELLPQICEKFSNTKCYGDSGEIIIDNINMAFCHRPDDAKTLADAGKYQMVFYGHNHKPWMETLKNGCQLVNPGTLGGLFQKATFTVLDTATKKIELKILELL